MQPAVDRENYASRLEATVGTTCSYRVTQHGWTRVPFRREVPSSDWVPGRPGCFDRRVRERQRALALVRGLIDRAGERESTVTVGQNGESSLGRSVELCRQVAADLSGILKSLVIRWTV